MKVLFILFIFVYFNIVESSLAQINESWKVYDDSEVAVIRIAMNPNDLQFMYDNPHSDSMHIAEVHFTNAYIDEIIDSVGIRIRGNTSRESAKKSFKLSFNTFKERGKFYSLEKLNLNGEHNDPSIVRSKLCWDIFNKIGMISSRAAHAAVYINGSYFGLYISVEHIDDEFIQKNFDNNTGNLWKCLYGADLTTLNTDNKSAYTLKTNEEVNDYSELDTLTKVINNTTLNNFDAIIEDYFNVTEFLKSQAIDIIVGSWDDYSVLSNNYYLYHNPQDDIIHWIPYDYDNTFGIDWLGFDWANTNPYTFGSLLGQPRPLYNRLMQIPRYKNLLSHFIEFYQNTYIHSDKFNSYLDSLKKLIEPFAIADTFKTLDWGFTNDDFNESYYVLGYFKDPHVKYSIKEYNKLRKNSLDSQIEYVESEPNIYDYSISDLTPAFNEPVEINASIFSVSKIKSVSANITFYDGTTENTPFYYNPILETYRVEESDNWTAIVNPLGISKKAEVKIVVQDFDGNIFSYPNEGIIIASPGETTNELIISELMSSNLSIIQDNAGEYDDWLEIYNPQDTTVTLSGKYLTDKGDNLTKWQFPPNVSILPKHHILIWCDEDQEQAGPHINFKLSSFGEHLALVSSDGITVIDSVTFPALGDDESYSRIDDTGVWKKTSSPTPGQSNIISSVYEVPSLYKNSITAYPNPFNPSTIIEYEIARSMYISFKIFDILGSEVWNSEKEWKNAGKHKFNWNGINYNGMSLTSGIYLLNVRGDSYTETIKLMLVR